MIKNQPLHFIFLVVLFSLFAQPASAESNLLSGAHSYLKSGAPEKAVEVARELLSDPSLKNDERKEIWELIVKAEHIIAKAQHYSDVSNAVEAIETLIKEFPEQVNHSKLYWDIIQLYWNQNNHEKAQAAILNLQTNFPNSEEVGKSWLILGMIHFMNEDYADARKSFLRLTLYAEDDSHDAKMAKIWIAMVDFEEQRFNEALQGISPIFKSNPELITENDNIYTRYILLLDATGRKKSAFRHANKFLAQYKQSTHSSRIRLLQADLMLDRPKPDIADITKTYGILADKEAGTVIGRQAFMRKMMLQSREMKEYREIKPIIIALKRIGNENQMSLVEDEAFLHEAKLWNKVAKSGSDFSRATAYSAALRQYDNATHSKDAQLAQKATKGGSKVFLDHINDLISHEEWLNAISLWEHYPQFRPPLSKSKKLRFNIARGLKMLMQYEQAETILTQLHEQADGSVWGEKVMLERARLWLDRNDEQGIERVMQWLNKHEYTLYRPEFMVIIAHMHLQRKNAIAASHTLDGVLPEDLAKDTIKDYWHAQALTAEALSRWHIAAKSWQKYGEYSPENINQARLNQADALFKGKEFGAAEKLYAQIPETMQNPAWHYRYSISQLKNGKWTQAQERLNTLKDNPDAGIYASMATLTLAERDADQLLEVSP